MKSNVVKARNIHNQKQFKEIPLVEHSRPFIVEEISVLYVEHCMEEECETIRLEEAEDVLTSQEEPTITA